MMIKWNDKSFRWFENASEYTGYTKKMAELILSRIGRRGTLCDLGCGMALVDMELAGQICHVTCVDAVAEVVDYVRRAAKARGIDNLTAECCDASELTGKWDTVTALFFGETEDMVKRYLPMASDRLIAVIHADQVGGLGPKGFQVEKCNYARKAEEILNGLGIVFQRSDYSLEYGQPLRDAAAAVDFVRTYSKNPPDVAVEEYVNSVIEPIHGDDRYSVYIPNKKEFSIFVIRREDNEDFCGGCAPRG